MHSLIGDPGNLRSLAAIGREVFVGSLPFFPFHNVLQQGKGVRFPDII